MMTLTVNSRQTIEMIDISHDVKQAIADSGIRQGQAMVFTPHTTAAITINENADPDVAYDMLMEINKIVPLDDGYRHMEGNSAAHLKSSLFGASEGLIVQNGQPLLGTWQGIYFCEFDGPRRRQIHIQVVGE